MTDHLRSFGQHKEDGLGGIFRVVNVSSQPQAGAQDHRLVAADHRGEGVGVTSVPVTAQQLFVCQRLEAIGPGTAGAPFPMLAPVVSRFDHAALLRLLLQ
jgi:hypothetical protein